MQQFHGSTQVALNMVQQLNYDMMQQSSVQENSAEMYSIFDEIDSAVGGFIVHNWPQKNLEVSIQKSKVPSLVKGNVKKFRICLRTLLEFAFKYSTERKIELKIDIMEYPDIQSRNSFII